MTNPLMELPRHFRPRCDRAGKKAGTTDDQRLMIVFVVMVFVMTMARAPARAMLPWSFKTGEIREISAIVRVYTKPVARTTANRERTGRFCGPFAPFLHYCRMALYSAATTASPIAAVPTCRQPGVAMSPVR